MFVSRQNRLDLCSFVRKCVKLFYLRDIGKVISTCSIEKMVNRINRRVTGGERDFDRVIVISFSRKMVENRSFSTVEEENFGKKHSRNRRHLSLRCIHCIVRCTVTDATIAFCLPSSASPSTPQVASFRFSGLFLVAGPG